MPPETKTLQVAILLFDGLTPLDAIGPYDCVQLLDNVEVVFVAHKPGPCATLLGNLALHASASFHDVPTPDILIVPGGLGVLTLLEDEPLLGWIRKAHETALYTTSVCTGSILLAAAGLLKGLQATTHWKCPQLLERYGAKYTSQRVVQEGKIVTAAGVSSGIDMALVLISLIADEDTAKAVQLMIEYDPLPPFESGSVAKASPQVIELAEKLATKNTERANFPIKL